MRGKDRNDAHRAVNRALHKPSHRHLHRSFRRLLAVAFAAALTLALGAPAFAAQAGTTGSRTYKVRIYSGQRGTIDGGTVQELSVQVSDDGKTGRVNFNPDGSITLISSAGANGMGKVSLSDNKYYVKGIRESGKDNEEANSSFVVDRDMDFVVAYGILGNSVAYTVNYLDGAGNALLPSETYYGNIGDRPVIAYQYIEGWQPQAYNLTRTLSENAAENVFDFVYTQTAGAAAGAVTEEGAATVEGAAGAGAGADAAGAAGGVVAPDEATPQDLVNLDDEETPLANIGNGIRSLIDPDGDGLLVNIPKPVIGVGLAAAALLLFLIALWCAKKKKEYGTNE